MKFFKDGLAHSYITGNSDFRTEVRKKLEYADPRFMVGYIENSSVGYARSLLAGRTQ